jgi:hypothetical protein
LAPRIVEDAFTMPTRFRRLRLALLLALPLGAACETFAPDLPDPAVIAGDRENVVDDREIVVLSKSRASAEAVLARAAGGGYTLVRREPLPTLGFEMLVFRIPAAEPGQAAIRRLESADSGVSAGLNHAYTPSFAPTQSANGREFASELLGWPEAGCAARTPIGVIDGAIGNNHPALAHAEIATRRFAAGTPETTGSDHAATTAIILARQGGQARVRILNADVVGSHRQAPAAASVDTMVLALEWLAASGTRVVNISMAGPYNKILDRAIQRAIGQRMIIVASSGNSGPEGPARFPAAFKGVIAVTAVDAKGEVYPSAVRGPHIDFAAPGVDVFVQSDLGGRYVTGTSVATPHVTALIAALVSERAREKPSAIEERLSALTVDLGEQGRDPVFGFGLPHLGGKCPDR